MSNDNYDGFTLGSRVINIVRLNFLWRVDGYLLSGFVLKAVVSIFNKFLYNIINSSYFRGWCVLFIIINRIGRHFLHTQFTGESLEKNNNMNIYFFIMLFLYNG